MSTMVAALYVEKDGAYYGLDGVDPWPEDRDARLYHGPHTVVAHLLSIARSTHIPGAGT